MAYVEATSLYLYLTRGAHTFAYRTGTLFHQQMHSSMAAVVSLNKFNKPNDLQCYSSNIIFIICAVFLTEFLGKNRSYAMEACLNSSCERMHWWAERYFLKEPSTLEMPY